MHVSGDVAAPHDVAALQAEFWEQHPGVFDALQRSMNVASTSGDPVPDCIRQVCSWRTPTQLPSLQQSSFSGVNCGAHAYC